MNHNAQLYSTSHLRVLLILLNTLTLKYRICTYPKIKFTHQYYFMYLCLFNLLYSNNRSVLQSLNGHISWICLCRNLCRVTAIQFWTTVLDFLLLLLFWNYFIWCYIIQSRSTVSQILVSLYTSELSDWIYFYDQFLNAEKIEPALMKPSAKVTYCWSPEVRKCRNTPTFRTLIRKHRKPASSL